MMDARRTSEVSYLRQERQGAKSAKFSFLALLAPWRSWRKSEAYLKDQRRISEQIDIPKTATQLD
jgi:hypothetical protein